ncbi:MAG TPA: hypothetical protein VNF26_03065 [Candidatus Baltobacterales bacterium]|nr:hypothetical protein [Candidatus Baltobacterales bacterium]
MAALLFAIMGLLLGLPLGIPGLVLGPIAYFLGKAAVRRIETSDGALGGRGAAIAGWVMGVVATAIGAAVTLVWLVVVLVAVSGTSSG